MQQESLESSDGSAVNKRSSASKRSSSSKQSSLRSSSRQASATIARQSGSKRSGSVIDDEVECSHVSSEEFDETFLRVEKTLAIIKPEAVKFEQEIKDVIIENEFEILAKRHIQLTPEQVAGFYKEHFGQPYFANMIVHMSDNPVIVMCLAKQGAIEEWLKVIGPTNVLEAQVNAPNSLRAVYGLTDDGEFYNAVHGSKDFVNSLREIHFFFPKLIEEPILRGRQVHDYLQERVNSTLLKGLEELCKEKPEDPLIWLADWLLTNNPYSPEIIPPTDAMSGSKKSDLRKTSLLSCSEELDNENSVTQTLQSQVKSSQSSCESVAPL